MGESTTQARPYIAAANLASARSREGGLIDPEDRSDFGSGDFIAGGGTCLLA